MSIVKELTHGHFARGLRFFNRSRTRWSSSPRGEVYHVNECITPFCEGPVTIAHSAAKKGDRPLVCVPCGVRHTYVQDPMPELLEIMDELERNVFWRPSPKLSLEKRIYRIAEGALALKGLKYLGQTSSGSLPDRVRHLMEAILGRLEDRYNVDDTKARVPERIKTLNRTPSNKTRRSSKPIRIAKSMAKILTMCISSNNCSVIRVTTCQNVPLSNAWPKRSTSSKKTFSLGPTRPFVVRDGPRSRSARPSPLIPRANQESSCPISRNSSNKTCRRVWMK